MKKKLRLNTLNAFQAGIALLVLSHVNMAGAYDCSSLEEWQSSDVYVSGDKVIREFSAYQAKWWNQSQDPLTNSKEWDVWQLVDTCSGISSSSSSSSTTTTSSTSSTGGRRLPQVLEVRPLRGQLLLPAAHHRQVVLRQVDLLQVDLRVVDLREGLAIPFQMTSMVMIYVVGVMQQIRLGY